MKKFYSGKFTSSFLPVKEFPAHRTRISTGLIALFCLFEAFSPLKTFSQSLEFSYSYVNLTRNNGGGTMQQGDTIEVHALVKVNAVTNNFYYLDTVRTGTQYINNSLKLVTNEEILFRGPFTDGALDDVGLYDISGGIPRIRINLGSGATNPNSGIANFGVTTGGGTITPGVVPKFYGTTLFIVAYRLLVTANFGDTIHLTGNYYFDTSGIKRTYRFNYAGIKIIQNQALCNNFSSASFTADSSFKSGNTQNRALPAIVPGYGKVNISVNGPADNFYAIANNTSANGTTNNAGPYAPLTNTNRVFNGYWDIIGDHTGAAIPAVGNLPTPTGQTGGYMLVVNAAYPTGEAYRDTIKNVCPNTYYEFSAWVRNICGKCSTDSNSTQKYTPGVLPNLSYTINDVDYYTTGNIVYDKTWQKRGFIYKTGSSETQFTITIKNNAAGGGGNDWVLDDIKLVTCYPNLINSPKDTATSCKGASLTLSDTVKSYFNNYVNFCWEKSTNGITWVSTGVCGTKIPVLVNGLWQYVVDTTFVTVAADSGTFYRLKVGTTVSNLTDPNCSVNNSQKIFVKVFNVNCTLLSANLLTFNGSIGNENAILKWSSTSENNLKEYVVEKSLDGINFFSTNIVAAVNGSNSESYTFNDPEKIVSMAYYRLRLVDKDNHGNKYSNVIVVYNKDAAFKVSTTNPFRDNLKLNVFIPQDGEVEINLYDAFGKVITRKTLQLYKGNSEAILDDVAQFPAGIYILRSQFNKKVIQTKLFKVN